MKYSKEDLDLKFKHVFSSPDGEDVLHAICNFCHLLRPTYSEKIDINSMIYKEGERNVAMYILNRINATQRDIIESINDNIIL